MITYERGCWQRCCHGLDTQEGTRTAYFASLFVFPCWTFNTHCHGNVTEIQHTSYLRAALTIAKPCTDVRHASIKFQAKYHVQAHADQPAGRSGARLQPQSLCCEQGGWWLRTNLPASCEARGVLAARRLPSASQRPLLCTSRQTGHLTSSWPRRRTRTKPFCTGIPCLNVVMNTSAKSQN